MSSSPVDVSRAKQCRLCRQHSIVVKYLDHKTCPFQSCKCKKCNLIRLQRCIMAEQIRLRRKDDNKTIRSSGPYSNYNCQKCKNHGQEVSKKKHNDCPYTNCNCELCVLAKARSYVELEIKQSCKLVKESRKMKSKGEMDNEMIGLMFELFAKNTQQTSPSISSEPSETPANIQPSQFNTANSSPTNFQPYNFTGQLTSPINFTPIASPFFIGSPQVAPNFMSQMELSNKTFTLIPSNPTFNFVSSPQTLIQPNYPTFNLIQNQQIPNQSSNTFFSNMCY